MVISNPTYSYRRTQVLHLKENLFNFSKEESCSQYSDAEIIEFKQESILDSGHKSTDCVRANVDTDNVPIYFYYDSSNKKITVYVDIFKVYANENSSYLFAGFNNLTDIKINNNCIDFSQCKDLSYAFYKTTFNDLVYDNSVNITFNSDILKNTSYMFAECKSTVALSEYECSISPANVFLKNVSIKKTSNITKMDYMYSGCSSTQIYYIDGESTTFKKEFIINLSDFDMSNVTTCKSMFENCADLIHFCKLFDDLGSVTPYGISCMFKGCSKLKYNPIEQMYDNWFSISKTNEENVCSVFCDCEQLEGNLDLTEEDRKTEEYKSFNFDIDSNLSDTLTISFSNSYSWNYEKPNYISLYKMFYNCFALKNVKLLGELQATYLYEMFGYSNTYSISPTISHLTAYSSNPSTIKEGKEVTLTYYAQDGYEVPLLSPNIVGADCIYKRINDNQCKLILSNPTQDITFSISGENYLRFIAQEGNDTINITKTGNPVGTNIEYFVSGENTAWQSFTVDDNGITLLSKNDKIYFRGNNPNGFNGGTNGPKSPDYEVGDYYKFTFSKKTASSGNIMSLIDYDQEITEIPKNKDKLGCFANLFRNCTNLISAPELPATTLYYYCYSHMFDGCTSLTTAPELPATDLTDSGRCYNYMFSGCESLTTTPELPATTLASSCYYYMFDGCSGITITPELPATTLDTYCYSEMFVDCTGLTSISDETFPQGVTLANYCYSSMFRGCKSLTVTPELPTTTLANGCYASMFKDCTSLTSLPQLPAQTLVESCYEKMFSGCTSLYVSDYGKTYWDIPTYGTFTNTTIQSEMFNNCQGVRVSNDLEANTGENCTYYLESANAIPINPTLINITPNESNPTEIIHGQTIKLTYTSDGELLVPYESPDIAGASLVSYNRVSDTQCELTINNANLGGSVTFTLEATEFRRYNINSEISNLTADDGNPSYITSGEFGTLMYYANDGYIVPDDVTSVSGAEYFYQTSEDKSNCCIELSNPTNDITIELDGVEIPDYLCFTNNDPGGTIELIATGELSGLISNTAYSRDGVNWTTFTPSTTVGVNTIEFEGTGDKVYFRNDIIGNFSDSNYLKFLMTGSISASGNINSMYSATGFESLTTLSHTYCYYRLFYVCTSLTTAPSLPATNLASYCYNEMFYGCTSLTTAPSLPATTLASGCYCYMFYSCTSLTIAPSLPATTLASSCYAGMFCNCTSLTIAPSLPATALSSSCYANMFNGCTSLTTAPSLPATNLASGCYYYMFYSCTSLTIAPALPATALSSYCYAGMFCNCTSLYVSDTSGTGYDKAWNIPSSGTFTNSTTYNQSAMFTNCLGTRSSNAMSGATGGSHTYYTQNTPV